MDNEVVLTNWKKQVDNNIDDRKFFVVIASEAKTNAIVNFYSDSKIKLKLSQLNDTKRWEFIDSFRNIDDEAFDLLKEYPESIEVFFKHTLEARKLLGQNSGIWMKYFKAKSLLKNKQYSELANLFGKDYIPPRTFDSLPGQHWLNGDSDVADL